MKDAPALQICLVNRISTIAKSECLEMTQSDLGRMDQVRGKIDLDSLKANVCRARPDDVDSIESDGLKSRTT
jgi:hypothetical protein